MTSTKPLAPSFLFTRCDPGGLGFETTADVERLDHVVGQPRAVAAIGFGIGIERPGYNLFAMGSPRTGMQGVVRGFLNRRARTEPRPPDWCYVHNFEQAHKPRALRLPTGRGPKFQAEMKQLVVDLRGAIVAAFESDEFRARRQEIEQELDRRQERAFGALQERAEKANLTIIRTPAGVAVAPTRDGEVIEPDEFTKLSDTEKATVKSAIDGIQQEIERIMLLVPKWRREVATQLADLRRVVTKAAAGAIFEDLRNGYSDVPAAVEYLNAVEADAIEHAEEFRPQKDSPAALILGGSPQDAARAATERRYAVNALGDGDGSEGAPVLYEDNPSYQNLVGRIEHTTQMGMLVTDFTHIKSGALLRANGGYLVLDVRKVLLQPFAWEGLKRALIAREVRVESLGQALSLISTVSLEPEPIPLDVKVVLVGDRTLYYLLHAYDPDFPDLFKVVADFSEDLERTAEHESLYARLLGTMVQRDELRPLTAAAVARVIEEASRMAGDAERLSMQARDLLDLLREADYWAAERGSVVCEASDLQEAIDARVGRHDRLRERMNEAIQRETVLIATDGAVAGQVNGLSIIQLGGFAFGRPSRITARVRLGAGRLIDIEREVELGGPLHSKGVLIISGFLSGRYAPTTPLSLGASLVFEQSYGGIDGDSASSAELYALLSALADAPIRQGFAVTGSVNQRGEVQAIGGVNEKIEGFFDVCAGRGLTGEQGVLIPASNVKHLMLRADVVRAAADGRFNIYAVETIDEGIALLTGVPAGARDADGQFPDGSVNQRVERRLIEFAEQARAFGRAGKAESEEEDGD
jgi:lon-related putative ATP-dependent protease